MNKDKRSETIEMEGERPRLLVNRFSADTALSFRFINSKGPSAGLEIVELALQMKGD